LVGVKENIDSRLQMKKPPPAAADGESKEKHFMKPGD